MYQHAAPTFVETVYVRKEERFSQLVLAKVGWEHKSVGGVLVPAVGSCFECLNATFMTHSVNSGTSQYPVFGCLETLLVA